MRFERVIILFFPFFLVQKNGLLKQTVSAKLPRPQVRNPRQG